MSDRYDLDALARLFTSRSSITTPADQPPSPACTDKDRLAYVLAVRDAAKTIHFFQPPLAMH